MKTWDELVQIRKDLFLKRDKSDNAFMRYLVASLYTKLPPLRQEEWIGAVFSDNGTNNYLDIDKKILVLRNYKTKKSYDIRTINIPKSLITTMKKYKHRFNTNLVVYKVTDPYKAMSCAGIASYLKNIFGCSVCILRKIYISNMLDDDQTTVTKRKDIALAMGHNLKCQEFLYSVFSKRIKYE